MPSPQPVITFVMQVGRLEIRIKRSQGAASSWCLLIGQPGRVHVQFGNPVGQTSGRIESGRADQA